MIPEEVRQRYTMERQLAAQIRSALPSEREAAVASAYAAYFRRFPFVRAEDHLDMGTTPGKLAFLRCLLRDSTRILEIGCGYGGTLRALAGEREGCVGLDVAGALISKAREQGKVAFVAGSAVRFDAGEASFDAAFSIDLVEHLHPDDLPAHLASVRRALRPGGCYTVMTPHRATGPHDVSRYFERAAAGLHLREYSYAELGRLAKAAGFRGLTAPLLPLRLAVVAPALVRRSLAPVGWKVPLERAGPALPAGRVRTAVFKAAALQTVCLVMYKPRPEDRLP